MPHPLSTYHLCPTLTTSASPSDPLQLGTLLSTLTPTPLPINHTSRIPIPSTLLYPPVTQAPFTTSSTHSTSGNFSAWARAIGLPLPLPLPIPVPIPGGVGVSGSAEVGKEGDVEAEISCDAIVTAEFDPDSGGSYVRESLETAEVKGWLAREAGRVVVVYLVTGLKVARNLRFSRSSDLKRHGEGSVSADVGGGGGGGGDGASVGVRIGGGSEEEGTGTEKAPSVGLGVKMNITSTSTHSTTFGVDDVVIGYRVNKYRVLKRLFHSGREVDDEGVVEGDEAFDESMEKKGRGGLSFVLVAEPKKEEEEARDRREKVVRKVVESGEGGCIWVV